MGLSIQTASAILATVQGCTFAGLDTVTVPVLKGGKANPFQGKVAKVATGHKVLLFTNQNSNGYLNKVRRHLEAEGKDPDSFQLSSLPWGERIEGTPFIRHKEKHYLQCVFLDSGSIEYRALEPITYTPHSDSFDVPMKWDTNEEIPEHLIIGLPDRSGSEHQGLDNEVIVRTFALESIEGLRAMKYRLP